MDENIHSFWALVEEHVWVNHQLLSNQSEQMLNLVALGYTESVSWRLDLVGEEEFVVDSQQDSLSGVIKFLSLWQFLFISLLQK